MPEISDAVRFTVVCGKEGPQLVAKEMAEGLMGAGYLISEVDDKFSHPTSCGYVGVHLHVIGHAGARFEVQVHTPESLRAREKSHPIYERARDAKMDRKERALCVGKMKSIFQTVPRQKTGE